MKRFKLITALVVVLSMFGFTSCDVEPVDSELLNNPVNPNNPNNPNNPPIGTGTFTVNFEGQVFTADQTLAFVTDGLMSITGIRGTNGESVTLVIPANGVGTYTANDLLMNYTPNAADEFGYTNISISTDETSGTVTITALDEVNHTISGTFSFTGWYGDEGAGVEPIEFTGGSFSNVSFTGTVPGNDTFTADVNGTPFNTQNIVPVWAEAGSGATISINALDDDLNHIDLFISDELPAGTYDITNSPTGPVQAQYVIGGMEYDAVTGTLIITNKTDTTIAGTFSFIGENELGETVTVTQGTFDVEY